MHPIDSLQPLRMPRLFFIAVLLALTGTAVAVEQAGLTVDHIQGDGWQAEGVRLQLELARDAGELHVARLSLPDPVGVMHELRIRCAPLQLEHERIRCPRAQFHLKNGKLHAPDFTGGFQYDLSTQNMEFHADDLPLGDTRVKLSARLEDSVWQVTLQAPALTLSSEDGRFASDKLSIKASLRLQALLSGGWSFSAVVDAPQGQFYAEPVFLDFARLPLRADVSGQWRAPEQQLVLEKFHIEQANALRANGALSLDFAAQKPLQSLQLRIDHAVLPGAYASYLQPFLIGTVLDSLETQGRITGSVGVIAGSPEHVRLELDELHLDDTQKRFAFYGLNGAINWQVAPGKSTQSQLRWEGGTAYQLDLGPADMRLHTGGGDVRLLEPMRLPVLDGALDIRRFELEGLGSDSTRVAFDGELLPVGMERLSRALGWPVFGGTLSGSIPTLEYRDGNLTVGGTLAANVFDGRVEVERLRLEQPFGSLPRLSADMKLRRIDLKAATSAFSFGRIEGRLDGDVKDLRLLKWQPVAFDGRLYTSPDDDTRHRISQRAIENISDLGGGGAAGVLSRGFMRFFDDFSYDRIALGCRLRDGICQMTGVEPHRGGGYYIVKGSFLPRIDVIGYATRVSWSALVEQLKSATKSDGPVIK